MAEDDDKGRGRRRGRGEGERPDRGEGGGERRERRRLTPEERARRTERRKRARVAEAELHLDQAFGEVQLLIGSIEMGNADTALLAQAMELQRRFRGCVIAAIECGDHDVGEVAEEEEGEEEGG